MSARLKVSAKPIGGSNRMLTVQEVAELLHISADTVYDEWRNWGLRGYRIGKHLRFREREVNDWVERQAA